MLDAPFPNRDTLCERCGYALYGLDPAGSCPECGQTIAESSPELRDGPPWQNRMDLAAWCSTFWRLTLRPRHTFRRMRIDGSNLAPRLFLISITALIGLGWCGIGLLNASGSDEIAFAWAYGMLAIKAVLVLTYVEALGVRWFSGRRGWRVPWRLAERVVCYAALGWMPAAILLAKAYLLYRDGTLERLLPETTGVGAFGVLPVALGLLLGLSILGFELLVWVGVRQVRYANARPETGST